MMAFCRGRGLSYPRFLAWAKRLAPKGESVRSGRVADARGRVLPRGTRALPERRRSADAFCEVRVGVPVFEIASGGVVVRVPSGFEAGELARLLRAIFEASRSTAEAARLC
jgi:hypothetical protein